MTVYAVFEDTWYEGGAIISIHSKEWFADYRAYRHAATLSREYDSALPRWDGYDWNAIRQYKDVTVQSFEVTP